MESNRELFLEMREQEETNKTENETINLSN